MTRVPSEVIEAGRTFLIFARPLCVCAHLQGFFGSLLAAFVLLPVVYYIPGDDCGRAEDSLNTLKQLQNSPLAIGLSLSFIFGLMLMNWTSQQISQQLSSVHRNLVSAVRTVLVWVGSIILYYVTVNDQVVYGEQWTSWSLLELAGFLVLVASTIAYSYAGIILAKEQEAQEALKGEFSKVRTLAAARTWHTASCSCCSCCCALLLSLAATVQVAGPSPHSLSALCTFSPPLPPTRLESRFRSSDRAVAVGAHSSHQAASVPRAHIVASKWKRIPQRRVKGA